MDSALSEALQVLKAAPIGRRKTTVRKVGREAARVIGETDNPGAVGDAVFSALLEIMQDDGHTGALALAGHLGAVPLTMTVRHALRALVKQHGGDGKPYVRAALAESESRLARAMKFPARKREPRRRHAYALERGALLMAGLCRQTDGFFPHLREHPGRITLEEREQVRSMVLKWARKDRLPKANRRTDLVGCFADEILRELRIEFPVALAWVLLRLGISFRELKQPVPAAISLELALESASVSDAFWDKVRVWEETVVELFARTLEEAIRQRIPPIAHKTGRMFGKGGLPPGLRNPVRRLLNMEKRARKNRG